MSRFGVSVGVFILLLVITGCSNRETQSLWRRHCESCHDGKTVLNGKVLISREAMKEKYRGKTLDEFVDACKGSAACMNILKHQEKLLRQVGEEMGIGSRN